MLSGSASNIFGGNVWIIEKFLLKEYELDAIKELEVVSNKGDRGNIMICTPNSVNTSVSTRIMMNNNLINIDDVKKVHSTIKTYMIESV